MRNRQKTKAKMPESDFWVIQPMEEYTDKAIVDKAAGSNEFEQCRGLQTPVGKIDGWVVKFDQILYFEKSRLTDKLLHFSVWYKNKEGVMVLWKSDADYIHRNPSRPPDIIPLKNGLGQPAKIPGRPRSTWRG